MVLDLLLPYRLRTVRVGVRSTYLVIAFLVAYPFLPGVGELEVTVYLAVLVVAVLGAAGVSILPWQAMFERGWGMASMYAWSALDIALISFLILFGGPGASEIFWVYTMTTIFFAASYPRRGQFALLGFTFGAYLLVEALLGWPSGAATIVLRLGVLGSVEFMAAFLSRELTSQMAAHATSRIESESRAELLAKVAQAGRAINSLDPEFALQAVVDAATEIGFEAATVNLLDRATGSYRPVSVRGLPDAYSQRSHSWDGGMTGLVRRGQRTVVVDDYESIEGTPEEVKDQGFRHVVGAPIWLDNEIAAVLIAGTRKEPRSLARQEIEAFELLAAEAGAALTNARRYEAERKTAERLAELDQLKTDFLTTISHELRTPLTLVSGGAQTLLDRGDRLEPEQREELIRAIDVSAQRLNALLLTVLDFARLQGNEFQMRLQPTDLGGLIRTVTARHRGLAPHRVIEEDVPAGVIVDGDGNLLDRVLDHLIANAVTHTPDEAVIMVRVEVQEEDVVLEVIDDGPGFDPVDLPHLGERFYRGHRQSDPVSSGMGLGLALARRVLALHGSALVLENREHGGARVCFRLPVHRRHAEL